MNTKLLDGNTLADLESAAKLLAGGSLVAVPTETVYGLAADASNPAAVAKIFVAKGRPSNHPLIVHIASIDDLADWADEIPEVAYKLAREFWPGPLTLLLKKSARVSDVVTGGLATVGIRMPNQPMFLKLLDLGRTAYAAPSANPYKQLSPVSAEQVMAGLGGKIAAIVDGGFCTVGVESTILDLSQMPYRILRRGPLSRSELQQAGGVDIESPEIHDVAVSGNVQDHYQPKTPLHLVSRSELAVHRAKNLPNAAYLSISADGVSSGGPLHVDMPNNPAGYAKLLYKTLYELDKQRPAVIWCETPVGEQWEYILDRLRKASSNY
jgi:L-threonylcarbamoyladenylate synthase